MLSRAFESQAFLFADVLRSPSPSRGKAENIRPALSSEQRWFFRRHVSSSHSKVEPAALRPFDFLLFSAYQPSKGGGYGGGGYGGGGAGFQPSHYW
jgi:hypothetical protein